MEKRERGEKGVGGDGREGGTLGLFGACFQFIIRKFLCCFYANKDIISLDYYKVTFVEI